MASTVFIIISCFCFPKLENNGHVPFPQGVGWWKFEFCFGRQVTQFHENDDGTRLTIVLGTFNKENHIEWIKQVFIYLFFLRDFS